MMRRNEQLRDLPYFTHEEYELMKMPLAREEVPDGALAALSAWIEGERLLVSDPTGKPGACDEHAQC
jgi:hypothetical protein